MKLFPYQIDGAEWLKNKKVALLADEMGLGKSAQSISAADQLGLKRILVCGPAISRRNWRREFKTWSKYDRDIVLVETKKDLARDGDVVITSYDLIDPKAKIFSGHWDALILDEAHYLKALNTKRSKTVYGKGGLAHRTDRIWALTGTPAPNHPGELWVMLRAFGATDLNYESFLTRFCEVKKVYFSRHQFRYQIIGANEAAIPDLKKVLAPIMLRRMKSEVLTELPPIKFSYMTIPRSEADFEGDPFFVQWIYPGNRMKEFRALIAKEEAAVKSVFELGKGTQRIRTLEALSPSISTLRMYTGAQKVDAISKMIDEELTNGEYEKIVVFAIHATVIMGIRNKLSEAGHHPVTLYGETPPAKRERNVIKFQTEKKCRVLIGNIQAAGTNITLTSAHQVLFVEQSWVPGDNAQAAMRCHRIGQTKPVTVRVVGLEDSIDAKVAKVLMHKTRQLTSIFDAEISKILVDGQRELDLSDLKANEDEDIFS